MAMAGSNANVNHPRLSDRPRNIRYMWVDRAPQGANRLGSLTIAGLIVNRTIGSGIFVTPHRIYEGTGRSAGTAILFWLFGGVVAICGLLVWLELGLSVPLCSASDDETDEDKISIPRSGGEKNFIEFLFPKPEFLASCLYGIAFVILGNLSGNGIAFGQYCLRAAGRDPNLHKPEVMGVAVVSMTVCVLLHGCSRRGGILASNIFAVFKLALLVAIIILGFIAAAKRGADSSPPILSNISWKTKEVVGCTDALLFVVYSFSGFEQPFYVLSEVRSPRRLFPWATIPTMMIVVVLFFVLNIAYLAAVPVDYAPDRDFATLLLENALGGVADAATAQRIMAALIAVSIMGNLIVMTFTAARVKQEIAKEGIIPFSMFFMSTCVSPVARLRQILFRKRNVSDEAPEEVPEQVPAPALALQWFTSVLLIAITSFLSADASYSLLISLYSYMVVIGNGFVVSGGLLYLTFKVKRQWSRYCNYKLPFRPLHTIIYFFSCGFMLFAAFAKPTDTADSAYSGGIKWFVVPTVGLSGWVWGLAWFVGLQMMMRYCRKRLEVTRVPWIEPDQEMRGQWIQRQEDITHEWVDDTAPRATARHFLARLAEGSKMV